MATISEESRIRELAESIRTKCAQAQQIRQQTTTTPPTTTATTPNVQPQQNEVRRRLKEVIVRLQEEVRDPSLTGIQQRLQYTASKFGLTFTNQRSTSHSICCYLSSESFYIEVCIDDNGRIISTSLVLGQDTPQNSELLVSLLRQYDYPKFEAHVKSLVDMFSQISGQDKSLLLLKVMFAIENVLQTINASALKPKGILDTILSNHLGYLTPRKAGLPMQLTFFITPYDALQHTVLHDDRRESLPETVGVSAKVLVERSTQIYRLPTDPNLFNPSQSSFQPISEQNSVFLPITLVLCLNVDIPVCAGIMEKLQQTVYGTDQSLPPLSNPHINQLILLENKDSIMTTPNSKHTIYLPGQVHEYTGIGDPSIEVVPSHRGVLLPNRKVPFTQPMHVVKIIHLLRQQLVYNELFRSCLMRKKKATPTTSQSNELSHSQDYSFHVMTQPPEMVAITTKLLNTKGGTTFLRVEFLIPQDINGQPTQPKARLQVNNGPLEQSAILNKVLARCLSIPVTLHTLLSRPTKVLTPSVAAIIKEHQNALVQFDNELRSCDVSCDPMEVGETSNLGGLVAGTKRKRVD